MMHARDLLRVNHVAEMLRVETTMRAWILSCVVMRSSVTRLLAFRGAYVVYLAKMTAIYLPAHSITSAFHTIRESFHLLES